jgi:pre-mRNA-splicing helicase BRR2
MYKSVGITSFNPIQTQTFHELYEKDANALVCAPTGSGKTICAEFAILRSLSTDSKNKTVYIHPKAEGVEIMARHWSNMFSKIGIAVGVLTGDAAADTKVFAASSIVLSTTRNFDAYSRRWKQRKAVQNASLVIFDELHLLGGTDGPTLEVCISRMRYIAAQTESQIRFLGLSASLANANDVGSWMGVKSGGLFNFSPKVRPIPLEIFMQSSDVGNFSSRCVPKGSLLRKSPRLTFYCARQAARVRQAPLQRHQEARRQRGPPVARLRALQEAGPAHRHRHHDLRQQRRRRRRLPLLRQGGRREGACARRAKRARKETGGVLREGS